MDVMKLCNYNEETGHYEADPGVFVPAIVARIKAVRAGAVPSELGTADAAKRFQDEYRAVSTESLLMALYPVDDYLPVESDPPGVAVMRSSARASRAQALAFVNDWFSRALALEVGGPVHIHILRNEDYRR